MKIISLRTKATIGKVLSYLHATESRFFKNNPTTRRKLARETYEIVAATKFLVKKGIFIKHAARCYQLDIFQVLVFCLKSIDLWFFVPFLDILLFLPRYGKQATIPNFAIGQQHFVIGIYLQIEEARDFARPLFV